MRFLGERGEVAPHPCGGVFSRFFLNGLLGPGGGGGGGGGVGSALYNN